MDTGELPGPAFSNAVAPMLKLSQSLSSRGGAQAAGHNLLRTSGSFLSILYLFTCSRVDLTYKILATSPRSQQGALILTNGIEINLHGDQIIHLLTEKPFRQVLGQSQSIFHGFTKS